MSYTFAQKAIARAAGLESVAVGQVVDVRPDRVLSHDNTAPISRVYAQFGQDQIPNPDRLVITLDHAAPPPTPAHAKNHTDIRAFVKHHGVEHFFEVGRGICHQVHSEEALILPGQMILGSDSHTPHFGWLGAFGAGIGRSEVAVVWATQELWLRVPETVKITLTGKLSPYVTAKDAALHIIGKVGADGALYQAVEFAGDGIASLSIDSRMVLPNMMAEFGAKSAFMPPDETVFNYLAPRLARRIGMSITEAQAVVRDIVLLPDSEAVYSADYEIDLSALEPLVALPHKVDNVRPISEVVDVAVDQAVIGTCTNGRLEDIAAAANIVRGKRINPGTRFIVVPASSEVMQDATNQGYVADLINAGAIFGPPGCGPCMGNHLGVLGPEEVCISSANRNFRGRMGEPSAFVYLSSPEVVAASALVGKIADPRQVMSDE